MKIQSLKLHNIASLKGFHEIDFNAISETSNLFAITGKTGAGKSTILNCISLALYGEVYKKGASSSDFITLGESYGEIDLDFFINNKFYTSSWKLRIKKKNGEELKKPQLSRSLSIKEGTNKTALNESIEDITSLNFNQFCKTTILNQGEFSRFLTSSFTDRKDILEKFYDGENLDLLNIHLRNKLKEITHTQEEKENRIIGITQSGADINISQDDFNTITKQNRELKDVKGYSSSLLGNLKDIISSNKTLLINKERKLTSENKIKSIMTQYNGNSYKLEGLKKNYIDVQDILKTKKPKLTESIKKEVKLKEIIKSTDLIVSKISTIKEQDLSLKNEINLLVENKKSTDQKKSLLLESVPNILQFARMPITEDFNQFKLYRRELRYAKEIKDTQTNKVNESYELTKKLKNDLTSVLLKIDQNSKGHFQESLLVKQKAQNDLSILISNIKFKIKSKETLNAQLKALESKIKENAIFLKKVDSENQNVIAQLNDIKKIKQLTTVNRALNLCLQESIDKNHCIVCGNKEIKELRIIQDQEELDNSNFEKRHEDLSKELEIGQLKYNDTRISKITFENQSFQFKQDLKDLESSTIIEWNQIKNLPPIENTLNNSALLLVEKSHSDLENEIQKLNSSFNDYSVSIEKKHNIENQLKKLASETKSLNKQIATRETEIMVIKNKITELTTKYNLDSTSQDITAKIEKISIAVTEFKETLNQENLIELSLKNSYEKSQRLISENTILIEEQKTNTYESSQIIDFLKQNTQENNPTQELSKLENDCKEVELIFNKQKDIIKDFEIQLAEMRSKLDNQSEQITSSELLISTILAEALNSISQINFEINNGFKSLGTIQKICTKIKYLKSNFLNNDILSQTYQELKISLNDLELHISFNEKKGSEYATLIKRKKENQEKINLLKNELALVSIKFKKLEELNILIGKDEFRNYVLAIIESLLLEQTNKELKMLCQGRYGILQTNKKNKMASEFKIIDYFHDGLERKISTLSGGETFLVSLAMAMALAELTRGTTQIDSLFIDEGFGTLDSEAIQEVYELLMEIQYSGKQIGIISHVADLTSRIPVNINLVKASSGLSDINILLN